MGSKSGKREEKKVRKARGNAETVYDALENSMLGNPIDENKV